MTEANPFEEQQLQTRWDLLLRTSISELSALQASSVPPRDAITKLNEVRIMLNDLSTIARQRTQKDQVPAVSEKSVLPKPHLQVELERATSAVSIIETELASLKSSASTKSHRMLIEAQTTCNAKLKSIQRRIDKIGGFLSFKSEELVTVLKTLDVQFVRHLLVHNILLGLMEPNTPPRWVPVVTKVVEICLMDKEVFAGVLDHPALLRLRRVKPDLDAHVIKELEREPKTPCSTKQFDEMEYWLLTQVWVTETELMIDSLAISPDPEPAAKSDDEIEFPEVPTDSDTKSESDVESVDLTPAQVDQVMALIQDPDRDIDDQTYSDAEDPYHELEIRKVLDRAKALLRKSQDFT